MYADKINYVEKGTGEPLILLHGNGENLSIFNKFSDVFSQKFRVIAIDAWARKNPDGRREFFALSVCRRP